MKRFFISVCIVVALCAAGVFGVSAIEYPNTDLAQNYTKYEHGGIQKNEYGIGIFLGSLWANTSTSIANDHKGYSSVTVTASNGETASQYTEAQVSISCGGWVKTSNASVSGQKIAKKVNHYSRRCDSTGKLTGYPTNYYMGNS